MAEGAGTAGKGLAGCSGCAVVFFLALTILFTVGSSFVYELSDGKVSPAELAPAQYLSQACCCLSGVGMILGIVILLVSGSGKKTAV